MKKLLIVLAAFLYTSFATAMPMFAGGKIVGKVVDSDTKEALPGASVVVVGTTKGAVTNAEGDFFILNVDPGNYTLKASFVGYNETFQSNIRVSANLTTEVSFELRSFSLTTGTVEIIATRPLIDRNITNQNSIIDKEALRNLPIRDVQSVVATQSGVVRQSGNLYVRGSRADAVGIYVDGVKVSDPMLGGSNSSDISSAIEEIQFQAGGYTAEFGGSNAGIISTTSRSGDEAYKVSFDLLTDNFVSKNSDRKFLGGYSYGYSNYEATISGPILPTEQRFRFFIAGKNEFTRTPDRYWTGLRLENIFDPRNSSDTINI
ncbi:MAG: carboxypeptidase-like regulatory domain-containing protein, partial [Ignavibacteriales bacterium]|nr:carboxypeptidase-like regulatory domain-containing protein [Ignavibacteriales bacterium]